MQTAVTQIKAWLETASKNVVIVIALLIFVFPLGGYLMWKGKHFSKNVRWIITGLLVLWSFVLLSPSDNGGTYIDPYGELGGSCSASFEQNGCTYFRDGNCNVIGQSCN